MRAGPTLVKSGALERPVPPEGHAKRRRARARSCLGGAGASDVDRVLEAPLLLDLADGGSRVSGFHGLRSRSSRAEDERSGDRLRPMIPGTQRWVFTEKSEEGQGPGTTRSFPPFGDPTFPHGRSTEKNGDTYGSCASERKFGPVRASLSQAMHKRQTGIGQESPRGDQQVAARSIQPDPKQRKEAK